MDTHMWNYKEKNEIKNRPADFLLLREEGHEVGQGTREQDSLHLLQILLKTALNIIGCL